MTDTQTNLTQFNQRMAENARRVQITFDRLFSKLATERVPSRTLDAMRHGVLAGGKRFRPFLVIETARLFDIDPDASVATGAALECIHAYSLIHDDLPAMDDDDLRRGQPTVHKAFDEATAILAGDALLTLAFEILAAPEIHANANIRTQLIAELAKAAGAAGMVGGQALDLLAETRNEHSLEEIERIQSLKTGALISYACRAGCLLGEANTEQCGALNTYAQNIGLAFQLADDLLDAEGDAATVGKATGKDADAGKATFVDLLGVAQTRDKMTNLVTEAADAIAMFGKKSAVLTAAAHFVINRNH